jgi:hypothetical protein
MNQRVEVNHPVECEIYIGGGKSEPDIQHSRTCPQCDRLTWAKTSACMWCGHDRFAKALRWLVALSCLALAAVNIPQHF